VKTAVDIPDPLFRKAKPAAAQEGISLKKFFTEAILERLRHRKPFRKRWEAGFGGLRDLHAANQRIARIIKVEFETVGEEEWR
jgi:hypothetical protein